MGETDAVIDETLSDSPSLLSVLIVSWRTREPLRAALIATLRALDELASAGGPQGEVVVVDNASDDGTAEMVCTFAEEDDRVRLVSSAVNLGFAGGNNLALEHARGDVLAVVNPDVEADGAALIAMLEHLLAHDEAGLVTATLVGHDGRPQSLHRSLPSLLSVIVEQTRMGRRLDRRLLGGRIRRSHRLVGLPAGVVAKIGQAAGALLLLRRSTLARVGGYLFDESLPILFNDVDLSRRVHDAGLEVHLLTGVQVRHLGGAALGQLDGSAMELAYWDGLRTYARHHESRFTQLCLAAIEPRGVGRFRRTRPIPVPENEPLGAEPLVTVVVISHQYGHVLARAIESALAQTWPALEVLVIDDGSTDNTREVALGYAGQGVAYHWKPRGGLSQARNIGVARARGSAVVFLDADDEIDPTMVERCVSSLLADPGSVLAYPGATLRDDDGTVADRIVSPGRWDPELLARGNYIFSAHLCRVDVLRRFPFDEENRHGWEDWDFLLTLAEHGLEGVEVEEALLIYHRHPSSMTAGMDALRVAVQRRRVLRRHRRSVGTKRWLKGEYRYWRTRLGLFRRRVLGE